MLHVVLPVHNRRPITEAFVRALRMQTVDQYRLLLVNDGCTDGTVGAVQMLLPASQLKVIHGDGQLWWAGALQRAWQSLSESPADDADAVLITNDDVSIDPDFLAAGLAVLAEHPIACIQPMGIATGPVASATTGRSPTACGSASARRPKARRRIACPPAGC